MATLGTTGVVGSVGADNDVTTGASFTIDSGAKKVFFTFAFEYSGGGSTDTITNVYLDPAGANVEIFLASGPTNGTGADQDAEVNVDGASTGNYCGTWVADSTDLSGLTGGSIAIRFLRTTNDGFCDVNIGYVNETDDAAVAGVWLQGLTTVQSSSISVSYTDGSIALSSCCFGNNGALTPGTNQTEHYDTQIATGSGFPDSAQSSTTDEVFSGSGSDSQSHDQGSSSPRICHVVLLLADAAAAGSLLVTNHYRTPRGSPLLRM